MKLSIYKTLNENRVLGENKMINSLVGGLTTSIVTHPKDVIRIFIQKNRSILPIFKENILYRGYSKTILKTITSSITYFPINDTLKERGFSFFSASLISSIIGTTLTQPFDFLKTIHINSNDKGYSHSFRNYFRGLSLNLSKNIPSFVIMMSILDFLEND